MRRGVQDFTERNPIIGMSIELNNWGTAYGTFEVFWGANYIYLNTKKYNQDKLHYEKRCTGRWYYQFCVNTVSR